MNLHMPQAILLLGPTGSGKTPFGRCCERKGLWGKRCAHFDFGEELRRIACEGVAGIGLAPRDLEVVNRSLATGALLERDDFHIARAIWKQFRTLKGLTENDLLLLNGLPRHRDQALAVDGFVDVFAVLCLECEADVVYRRIAGNSGGDRSGRVDDSRERVRKKLVVFRERTLPLVDHYRKRGAAVVRVNIKADTDAEHVWQEIERRGRA